ncbi:protein DETOXIFICATION 21-like [Triticum aestivum]|uniref:protein DETOXIFICATION 21-like n=1 Tax=Triticum aestivum TaxID=4565 RepID=UPI001D022F38|nr:protein DETOXIFICATION 21-like [Triticum aestivum]
MEKSKVPLLEPAWPPADIDRRSSAGGDEGEEEGLGRRLVEENRKLWVVAGPSICTRFSTFGLTIISQAFIGHIGPTELAAYALVSTVLMRFSIDVLVTRSSSLFCCSSFDRFVSSSVESFDLLIVVT